MPLTRKNQFGFPPRQNQGSTHTVREIPLTQGVRADLPWPLQPPGSATSLSNLLILDGKLVPRSRLSSLGTVQYVASGGIVGLAELTPAGTGSSTVWVSGSTKHGVLQTNGSISKASFTSAFGLGVVPQSQTAYDYGQMYLASLDANGLVIAGKLSVDTLQVLYDFSGAGQYRQSYLTSAPMAKSMAVFDNYVIAWNVGSAAGQVLYNTRVQWCQRGNPSNWTGEGSGFEDLLAMRGRGTAVRGAADGRLILFTDLEIWYGVGASYPAQFTFNALDTHMGCPFPMTIQESELGFLFVGTDMQLRVLPKGGGQSTPVSSPVAEYLRNTLQPTPLTAALGTWGVYNPLTRKYYLFAQPTASSARRGLVVDVVTGEWSFMDCQATLVTGLSVPLYAEEGLYFGSSAGSVFSSNSLIADDSGSLVTAKYRSPPIAPDLAGNWKQLTKVCLDYRSTSRSTFTCKISQDGGNNYEATGVVMSLASAPVSGRLETDVYRGGQYPTIELTSNSTGFELHRLDISMDLGGRV